MSVRSTMRHRATVQRDASLSGARNDHNAPADPDWQDHIAEMPCHFWFDAGRERVDGVKTAVIEDVRLIVPIGADVNANDQITAIKDKLGNVLLEGPILIETVGRRRDHLELYVKEIAA